MRRFTLALVLIASMVTAARAQAPLAEQRAIDVAKSTARFSIAHIFVSRVTGTVPILSGTVVLATGSLIPASVSAVLDATRITTDEPDRDRSLESADYFDSKQYPTWTFTSSTITPTGTSAFAMDGLLTMHGVTQTVHLDATIRGDAAHPGYHVTGHIDRRAFGMKGTRLDPVIGTTADVALDVVVQ